jgi:hypothetical protein
MTSDVPRALPGSLQLPKLNVVGSSPIARSTPWRDMAGHRGSRELARWLPCSEAGGRSRVRAFAGPLRSPPTEQYPERADPSRAESVASQSLQRLLEPLAVGDAVDPSDEKLEEVLSFLERFVAWLLRESGECDLGIDGILPLHASKSEGRELHVAGWAILIDNQRVTLIRVRVLHDPTGAEIEWMECRLAVFEPDGCAVASWPWSATGSVDRRLTLKLLAGGEDVPWAFGATYG